MRHRQGGSWIRRRHVWIWKVHLYSVPFRKLHFRWHASFPQQRQQNKNNYWSETNAFVLINRFLFTWTVKSLQQDNINETRGWVWGTTEELYVIHCQELTLNAFLAPQRWLESFWELIKCQGTCHKIFDQVDLRRTSSTTNQGKRNAVLKVFVALVLNLVVLAVMAVLKLLRSDRVHK